MEDFVEVIEGIKTKGDVAKAEDKLTSIAKRMEAVKDSVGDEADLPAEAKEKMAALTTRMMTAMMGLDPEIMAELGPLMEKIEPGK
jgi:hypothetical protein